LHNPHTPSKKRMGVSGEGAPGDVCDPSIGPSIGPENKIKGLVRKPGIST
jgi:hypothetical protein